jgi:hypothetical protein
MSWDAMIIKGPPPSNKEFNSEGYKPPLMGQAAEVRKRISTVLGGTDWSDPSNGVFQSGSCHFVFALSGDDQIENIDVEVTGSSDPLPILAMLCKQNDWALLDMQTVEWIDLSSSSSKSWVEFQKAVAQVRSEVEKREKKWWRFWR